MDTDGALRHRSGHGTTSEACVSGNTKNFLVVGCGEPGGETGGGGVASGAGLAPQVLVAQRVLTGEHPTAPVAAQAIPVGVDM